ncbi:MAG: M23 family metallopeptidase [Clostridia bacterium]|nr:M23 family metallopeptidase [Clostridia bacterium]
MTNKKKTQNTAGGGLYIALAICILSVICIGVYSAIINIFDTTPLESPIPNGTSIPLGTSKDNPVTPPVTTLPPQADVDAPIPDEEPDESVNVTPDPPSYTLPVAGSVTKPFSADVLVYSETMNDYRLHNGVDLAATIGTPVKVFSEGVVCEIYEDPLMGMTVKVDHGGGLISVYQNLSTSLAAGIECGVKVEEGQVLGGVGETVLIECAEAPHLHFEVQKNGKPVDPMSYFQ